MAIIAPFLHEISAILRDRDGTRLGNVLLIEPPYPPAYITIRNAMVTTYPKGTEDTLESRINAVIPEARDGLDGSSWTAFVTFLVSWFGFMRDVEVENLLDTFRLLTDLVSKCNSALAHPSMGVLILPTSVTYSRITLRLAIGLDKQPELMGNVSRRSFLESGTRVTLPEKAVNIIRQAFVTCLTDRTGKASDAQDGKPEGRKTAIYTLANMCFKIIVRGDSLANAEQIFTHIHEKAPPLAYYPTSERVTYLYYLGRFHFAIGQFYWAVLALEGAYAQCRREDIKQRRLILIYLVASSIILGRFPSKTLYQRPEAEGFAEKFQPICEAIAKGDLATFMRLTKFDGPHAEWFRQYRIRVQLEQNCKPLVERSLVRKVFLMTGDMGDEASRKAGKAPTLNLNDVAAVMRYMQREQTEKPYVDPDFEGAENLNQSTLEYTDLLAVESMMASLIEQDVLNGYLSHKQTKFAVKGAKQTDPLEAGFPNIWGLMKEKEEDEVPGWNQ